MQLDVIKASCLQCFESLIHELELYLIALCLPVSFELSNTLARLLQDRQSAKVRLKLMGLSKQTSVICRTSFNVLPSVTASIAKEALASF